jgi:hypothetical protein
MKNNSCVALFLIIGILWPFIALQAQYPNHELPQYPDEWNARWVTHPDINETAYNLIHFRKTVELDRRPEQFIIHISGDNRYRLYVNGEQVVYGPQLSDIRHWRYETVDLSPYLKQGENVIAAEVMNWGEDRSYGIMSFRTGFMVQGHTDREAVVNTGGERRWKVYQNPAMHEKTVNWIYGDQIVGGFYAANPTDSVIAADYPWGWENRDYDDSNWKTPESMFYQAQIGGAGHGWLLQPRTTPIQVNEKEMFKKIARTDVEGMSENHSFGDEVLTIPANSLRTILVDQGYVTTGYPKLTMSGGKQAKIQVKYAEALYDENNQKGHRDSLQNKVIKGISDVYVMDGGKDRTFQPIWFRTFRFVQLKIQTEDEPLQIENFYNVYSSSPIEQKAEFKTDDPIYDKVWGICSHGLDLAAQDNLLSDLYYEQMQYVGDLRPHLKAWTALTGDFTYFRSALEQFNYSRLPDGNVRGCYPLDGTFVYPTYSLVWIDMLHDYMMQTGDREFLNQYTGEIQEVFDYYESLINQNGLVGNSEYPMFIDWYLPKGGNSPVNKDGNSAILTLNYVYTLQNAAEIMAWLGYREKASYFRSQSRKYAEIVRKQCFDSERGIYADDPEQTFYDQRASILAVLAGAHTEQEKEALMKNILDPNTKFDSKANLFYYFYLFEAMAVTDVGNFTDQLEPWEKIVEMGMTATPEKRIEQHPRSEVHPWSAHPVHYFFSVVAGIEPASPGFNTVRISPQPGELNSIVATYPTIHGKIEVNLSFNEDVRGGITLPEGISGEFIWQDETIKIDDGENEI